MSDVIHASAVAFDGRAVVLMGRSGSGKSTLAWQLLGLGGDLVADDRVCVTRRDTGVWLTAPDRLQGKIEARGLGVLMVPAAPAWARLVVDMDHVADNRMPAPATRALAGVALPLISRLESPAFAPILRAYLNGGLWDGAHEA